jgi:hypothetical protein
MELIESTGALVRPDHAINVVKATHCRRLPDECTASVHIVASAPICW